ncbi:MAG: hypothetical protein AB7G28_20800 [Pirellulales bacterium]
MQTIKSDPHRPTPIPDPADPLGPPLGYIAYGQTTVVLRGPGETSDDALEKAETICQQMKIARKGVKNAVDRRARRGKNST